MATPAKSPVPRKKMNDKAGNGAWVGKRMKRKEDPRMIRGISHYTDDLKLAGMVHCAFARSPHAHAEIQAIRTDAAKALPGVIAVYTSADTTSLGPVPCAIQMPDLKVPRHPVLAEGHVRSVGAPVAVVVAEDFYTARPVKWNEGRRENFMATIHGRDALNDVELALKKDGTILGLRARVLADMGAYHQLLTPLIPQLTALMHAGCYKIPAIQIDIVGVFTNKMSTDAYRGAGRPEATFNVERIMELGAREMGMDPAEIRRKNFPMPKEFPYTTVTGLT